MEASSFGIPVSHEDDLSMTSDPCFKIVFLVQFLRYGIMLM
jgi:hypothetical protein